MFQGPSVEPNLPNLGEWAELTVAVRYSIEVCFMAEQSHRPMTQRIRLILTVLRTV